MKVYGTLASKRVAQQLWAPAAFSETASFENLRGRSARRWLDAEAAPRRGLDDRNFYLRPGGDTSGADGVDFFRGEEAVLEYYANVLRRKARTPAPAPASSSPAPAAPASVCAPGDAQIAAAEVVRLNYLPDIEDAEARARARDAAATEAPSTSPAPVRRQAPGKRPARRSARRSLEEVTRATAPRTPPRSPQVLIATSPHVTPGDSVNSENEAGRDSNADSALSNGATSDGESGKVNLMLNDMQSGR
ncbi:hypothetical protein ON010_g6278 [Phytophthora cinnamomi]|nr:hypothetical protein ON010_g6278 [Phytophthora cinnamomi]